jgi:O-antigen biosynthesis protein
VQKAIQGMQAEVLVVDNNSADGSLDYLQPRFPWVHFMANTDNVGFARANNQAFARAKGRYILFLNPDTLVPEDALANCLGFMEATPDAGALGIRMIDGSGSFLKESKRAFPSPLTSLYKLMGLARLFPRSKTFARYHLGHLSENENHEVDVLAGAFMLLRRSLLDKIGSFDEGFFMYGEDVDLSFRVQQAGFKNYYFAQNSIIHFKGESTRKGSLNYVRMFYHAMSIFVQKHYGGSKAGVFNFLIQSAIWLRAGVSAIGRFIKWMGLPIIDATLILLSFWLMKTFWSHFIRTDVVYPYQLLWIVFPVFTIIYLVTAYFAGLYDKLYKQSELNRSTLIATMSLLVVYALLPEHYRFSRGIILFGGLLSYVFISLLRWLMVNWQMIEWHNDQTARAQTVIAGTPEEYKAVCLLLKEAGLQERILGRVAVSNDKEADAVGNWQQLMPLRETIPYREIIYCEGVLSFAQIVQQIQTLPKDIKLKFHAAGSSSIVGSDSKDSAGEILSFEKDFRLALPVNQRLKRLIDIAFCLFFLLTFPVQLLGVKRPGRFFANLFQVLIARCSWVGYADGGDQLPPIRRGILGCNGVPFEQNHAFSQESLQRLDYWYARDYEPGDDAKLIWKSYRNLGG